MSDVEAALSLPRLPLRKTVYRSYLSCIQQFPDLMRASWLWLLVVGIATAATHATEWQTITLVLLLLAGASIAVAWHRLLILGERPGFSTSNMIGYDLWSYVTGAVLLFLITFVPINIVKMVCFSVFSFARDTASSLDVIRVLLLRLAVMATIALATCRLALVMPARAVGHAELTFKKAWARTRNNTWPLFCGALAASLPQLLVLELFSPPVPNRAALAHPAANTVTGGDIAHATLYAVLYLLALQVSIGFLSHVYRHFFQGGLAMER